MAARSPVVIDSSPLKSLRPPPVTPPPRRPSTLTRSSSPGFVSPSAFVRPLAKGLASGSRAQQVPKHATAGFASAASLLRARHVEAQDMHAENAESKTASTERKPQTTRRKQSSEKPARPSKTKELRTSAKNSGLLLREPLLDLASQDYTVTKDRCHGSAQRGLSPDKDEQYGSNKKYRQPSMSLSEFKFPGHGKDSVHTSAPIQQQAREASVGKQARDTTIITGKTSTTAPAKKTKKRTPAQDDAGQQRQPKRSRKKFTKSESIILNSDEPDPAPVFEGHSASVGDSMNPLTARSESATALSLFTTRTVNPLAPSHATKETSTYFANPSEKANFQDHGIQSDCQALKTSPDGHGNATTSADPAVTGRIVAQTSGDTIPAIIDVRTDSPRVSLANLVNGLGYTVQDSGALVEKHDTILKKTNRRRMELADTAVIAPIRQCKVKPPPTEPVKKPKALKKKPQTITDLATRAYQPEDPALKQPTVSTIFAAQSAGLAASDAVEEVANTAKVKKPRKPRTKKSDGKPPAPKATKTTKRAKSRTRDTVPTAELYTPEAARAVEQNQGFLFGTSSQLAVEDSPTFLQQMQAALHDSEMSLTPPAYDSADQSSRTRVVSAPEGTNLSVGQAYLNHWCQAARDKKGEVLDVACVADAPDKCESTNVGNHDFESNSNDLLRHVQPSRSISADKKVNSLPSDLSDRLVTLQTDDVIDQGSVGLCEPSPSAPENTSVEISGPAGTPPSDDSWMELSSDGPSLNVDNKCPIPTACKPPSPKRSIRALKPPQPSQSVTSPLTGCDVLQAMDVNKSISGRTSPLKDTDFSPRRPSSMTARSMVQHASRKLSPRHSVVALSARRENATARSASQPMRSSGWADIDDISDFDTPTTPSPHRRRTDSTPPAVNHFDLEAIVSPSVKPAEPATVITSLNIKATDDEWPALMAAVFPQITAAIRSTAPSTDINNPTWHEKILLYDPIVLEDLTSWLNDEGLRLEMQRLKTKPKTKGRKKQDAVTDIPEYETVKEELKPWMVQKWCEERSICCLWKEGLNGARRNRY